MNRCLKRVVPLIVALAATGAWGEQGQNDAGTLSAERNSDLSTNQPPIVVAPSTTYLRSPGTGVLINPPVVAAVPGRITLFEYPNFGGPGVTVDSSNAVAQNLDWANFDNPLHRAESARVESGTWRICSAPSFQGTCRVVGPGDYAYLGINIASLEPVLSPQLGTVTTPQVVIVPGS